MTVGTGSQPSALLGLFRDPEEVAGALDALRNRGFEGGDLKVLSSAPYPEGAFGEEPERHHVYLFALMGAAVGLIVSLALSIGTQLAYPMVTGGKPILSIPPIVNMVFELTLLGAVVFSMFGILFESRLPDFSTAPYDPRISEGYLGVLVLDAGTRAQEALQTLQGSGAVDVVGNERPAAAG